MARHIPVIVGQDDRHFLDKSIDATQKHLKSRSSIIRHLIYKARKDKNLLKIDKTK